MKKFEVVHEDDDLAVVNKFSGISVHPAGPASGDTLVELLAETMPLGGGDPVRPGIVHRLDKGTSGLMVVAKSQRAYDKLTEMVKQRMVARTYAALVQGCPSAATGRIDAPIARSASSPLRREVGQGKPSTTNFRVMEKHRLTSLLSVELVTGRTHQIRVHMSHIGHPVVGDKDYGGRAALARSIGLERIFLHAQFLSFKHPVLDAPMEFQARLPSDLQNALERAVAL